MDELSVHGLVVKAGDFGDYDRIITLLTEEKGIISVSVKGGKSLKSKFSSLSDAFIYGVFNIRKTGKYFYLFDGECVEDFYSLRYDIKKLALASYICDVAAALTPEGTSDPEILKLTLNSLYALTYKDTPTELIKGAFEFKAATVTGYMPSLDCCDVCGRTEGEMMYIDTRQGRLLCDSCLRLDGNVSGLQSVNILLPVPPAVLRVLRYLSECPGNRFLSFRLQGGALHDFSLTCEKYLINHLERDFYTLTFYKSLIN